MINDLVNRIIKPVVLKTNAYQVANADGLIKLDAMENPYNWPDDIKNQWAAYIKQADLNRYPDADVSHLRRHLKHSLNLPNNIDVLFGNGSDELIQIILLALSEQSNVVMAPEPGFVMYRLLSEMLGLNFVGVPLNENFSLNIPVIVETIKKEQPAVIFIARPNNPTGNAFNHEDVKKIINAAPGLVVIDEAYYIFARETMLSCLEHFPNVLIMRTFSKLGLAGLRLGMLLGASEWITEFNKLRLPYNIGTLNQGSAIFILENMTFLEKQVEKICQCREKLFNTLKEFDKIQVWKSETNFLLFRVLDGNAKDIYEGLLKNNILIKNLHGTYPLLDNCLRVTIGTEEENEKFLMSLKQLMDYQRA